MDALNGTNNAFSGPNNGLKGTNSAVSGPNNAVSGPNNAVSGPNNAGRWAQRPHGGLAAATRSASVAVLLEYPLEYTLPRRQAHVP